MTSPTGPRSRPVYGTAANATETTEAVIPDAAITDTVVAHSIVCPYTLVKVAMYVWVRAGVTDVVPLELTYPTPVIHPGVPNGPTQDNVVEFPNVTTVGDAENEHGPVVR